MQRKAGTNEFYYSANTRRFLEVYKRNKDYGRIADIENMWGAILASHVSITGEAVWMEQSDGIAGNLIAPVVPAWLVEGSK